MAARRSDHVKKEEDQILPSAKRQKEQHKHKLASIGNNKRCRPLAEDVNASILFIMVSN
jgi:hypothetical protein